MNYAVIEILRTWNQYVLNWIGIDLLRIIGIMNRIIYEWNYSGIEYRLTGIEIQSQLLIDHWYTILEFVCE